MNRWFDTWVVAVGGNSNNGSNDGFAYVNSNNSASNANANYGSRNCLYKTQISIHLECVKDLTNHGIVKLVLKNVKGKKQNQLNGFGSFAVMRCRRIQLNKQSA